MSPIKSDINSSLKSNNMNYLNPAGMLLHEGKLVFCLWLCLKLFYRTAIIDWTQKTGRLTWKCHIQGKQPKSKKVSFTCASCAWQFSTSTASWQLFVHARLKLWCNGTALCTHQASPLWHPGAGLWCQKCMTWNNTWQAKTHCDNTLNDSRFSTTTGWTNAV